MDDRTDRDLTALDADRALPPALYRRLESALLDDAAARAAHATRDQTGDLFDALDAPRPLPPATRAGLEYALVRQPDRRWRVLVAVAAAFLLILGSTAALTVGRGRSPSDVAAGPSKSVPEAGLPPVLSGPASPSTQASQPTAGGAAASAAPKRRPAPATSTTIACGSPCTVTPIHQPSPEPSGDRPVAAAASPGPSPPYVSSVDPSTGPMTGGTTVTIRGAGFTGATGVYFGESARAPSFTVVSDTEVRAVSPPSTQPQTVIVYVTFPGPNASTPMEGDSFTYTAP